MNDPFFHPDLESRIDRLVDGELSREEFRELLGSLDATENGWRQVALAFLEQQALASELSAVRDGVKVVDRSAIQRADHGAIHDNPRHWLSFGLPALGIAASFLITFGLGVWVQQSRQPTAESRPMLAVEPMESPAAAEPPQPESGPPRNLQVLVRNEGDGSVQQLDLPVEDWSDERAWRLSQPTSHVPAELQHALRRVGREMQRRRELMQLETSDGHRVVVPVEQWQVVPVDLRYQ